MKPIAWAKAFRFCMTKPQDAHTGESGPTSVIEASVRLGDKDSMLRVFSATWREDAGRRHLQVSRGVALDHPSLDTLYNRSGAVASIVMLDENDAPIRVFTFFYERMKLLGPNDLASDKDEVALESILLENVVVLSSV